MLLSIIIPAYNAGKYIENCLDSCFVLPCEDMEVIVVDDGSTDETPKILSQLSQCHKNLRLLSQSNQGQSVARNLAIENAQGDYIYMVDADDRMLTQADNKLSQYHIASTILPIDVMRKGLYDIIGLQVLYQQENGTLRPWSHQMTRWPFDKEFATGADFVKCHNIEGLVYGYLFKRSLFIQHPELRFTPGIYHQDEELIFKIFTLAGPTIYKRGYTYLYYEHSGSSINTHTAERKRKLMEHYLIILRNLIKWRDEHGFQNVMRYKLAFLAMDTLRMLITQRHDIGYAMQFIDDLKGMNLYPLPWIRNAKYLGMKALTCTPSLVRLWIKLNDKVHRTDAQ